MSAKPPNQELLVHDSINGVDRADWSALELPSPFLAHGWLSTIEALAISPPRFRYFVLYQGATLVGAVVAEVVTADQRHGSFDRAVLGRAAHRASRLGLSLEPALVCSAFDGYGSTMLHRASASADERRMTTARLLQALQDFASDERLSLGCCGLTDEDGALAGKLESSGFYRSTQLPIARLALPWTSFDDYLASMRERSTSVAKDIRRERNRLAKSDTKIVRFVPEPSDESRLFELTRENYRKYGDGRFPYEGPYFSTLAEALGEDLVVYGAWKGDRLVAYSLMLRHAGAGWGTYFGCDYEACRKDHTYFNIVFNRPIEEAIGAGLSHLYFGRGLHELKCRRGCDSVPSYLFYRPRNRLAGPLLGPALRLRSRYFVHKARRASSTDRKSRLKGS